MTQPSVKDPSESRDAEEPIQKAQRALAEGRVVEAERLFLPLLSGSAAADAHKGWGDVLLRRGRLAKAGDAYQAALKLRPLWPEAENNLGSVFKLQGNNKAAEHHYRRALAAKPLCSSVSNNLGVLLAEGGRLDEAIERFREALSAPSAVPEARRNLATALLQLGRFAEARAEFDQALVENPDDPVGLVGLARLLRATGEPQQAFEVAIKSLRLRPGFSEGYIEAGAAALAQGDPERALPYCRHAVETAPNDARAHEALAAALLGFGVPQDAEHHFRRALALAPNTPSVLIKLGWLFEGQDRLAEAEENYRAALAADPDHILAMTHLGNLALRQKKPDVALAYFERAREAQPTSAPTHNNIASALNDLGRHEEAAEACRQAIALNPNLAQPHHNLGATLQTLGRLDEARRCYERAIELDPSMVPAIYALSNLAPDAASEGTAATIGRLLANERIADETKVQLLFARVRLCEAGGDCDAAFAAAVAANRIQAQRQSYDPLPFERLVAGIEETFTAEFFAQRRAYGSLTERPIFVLGMPRSGTTLIEQVLASHPQVFGAGELSFLPLLAADLRRWGRTSRSFPHGVADLHEPEVLRLAGAYRSHTRALAGPGRYVTDKMTSNLFYLGLAALLFPRAKIIYCRRDAFDLFISGYFTLFRNPIPYTTDQKNFAHYYKLQERLLAHWRNVLPLEIHDIEYESFVASQESQTKALLEYCELGWDARCLDFHLTERPVRTSSDTQVRRPLYSTSVGRAGPYRKDLAELEAALGAL